VTGSRVAVEALGPDFADPDVRAKRRERMDRIRAVMAKADPQREIPRNDELWYFEERGDVGEWFGRHGWDVTVTPSFELMAGYDRRPAKDVEDTTPHNLFVAALRSGEATKMISSNLSSEHSYGNFATVSWAGVAFFQE